MNDQIKLPPEKTGSMQSGGKVKAIVPQNIEEAFRMADAIFMSGMYPESYAADSERRSGRQMQGGPDRVATTSRIMVGIQKAMEVGLPPISGLSAIYIVNNRPTIYGDGIPALLYSSGKVTKFKEWSEGEWGKDDYVCKCLIQRNDMDDPIERQFSWADAKKAGLTGKTGPWTTHPKRQLQMRARGFAARDGAADILNGLGIYEEVIDIPEKSREVDTSSLDDNTTTPSPETIPPVSANPSTPQLPKPDNSNLMQDLQFDEPEPVPVTATEVIAAQEKQQATFDKINDGISDIVNEGVQNMASVCIDQIKKGSIFRTNDAFGIPVCQTCNGKQAVNYTQENPETGEVDEGIQPCPDCNKPTTNR